VSHEYLPTRPSSVSRTNSLVQAHHLSKATNCHKLPQTLWKVSLVEVQSFVSSKDRHHIPNPKGPQEGLIEEFKECVQTYSMDVQIFLLLEKNLTGGCSKNSKDCVQTYSMNVQSCRLLQRPLSHGKLNSYQKRFSQRIQRVCANILNGRSEISQLQKTVAK